MTDRFDIICPYCGESVELDLECDIEGDLVQDCEVCCNPWQVNVRIDDNQLRSVTVTRADGSE